ncbi:MAG: DUF2231 domain-containing protein [bacterium]
MIPIPEPLHPAVVHFPIALLLIGAGLSVFALIFRRWAPPTALILCLGALSAVVAVQTGEREEHRLPKTTGPVHEVLENHEHAAKRARNLSLVAAALSVASVLSAQWRKVALGIAAATVVLSLMTAWYVVQTGHYGGALVYEHSLGVGKNQLPGTP